MADQHPPAFVFPRPENDNDIDRMFVDLVWKRGWTKLPRSALDTLLASPPDKKWLLIHHDLKTEWEADWVIVDRPQGGEA